jgi:hypothetical protein
VTDNKVVTLPLTAIRLILDRNQAMMTPAATEVLGRGDSPGAKPPGRLLPSGIVAALEKSLRGPLIDGNSYQVALQRDEIAALSRWCRAVTPLLPPADSAVFSDAADTLDVSQ